MSKSYIDISGRKFGKLLATKIYSRDRNGHIKWLCKCDCGNEKAVDTYHLRKNNITSCGCDRPKGKSHKQWTGCGELSGNFWNQITRSANRSRGRRKIELSITIEQAWELFLEQDRKCALSGISIYLPKRYCEPGTASLDRIDSSKGYVTGNVQWVHKDLNKMKNSFDQNYFIEMCKLVSQHNKI